jgi:hypothetical protein
MLIFVVSIVCWGLGGIVAYFGMALIPGITDTQRNLVIPLFVLGGVILATYQIVAKRRK